MQLKLSINHQNYLDNNKKTPTKVSVSFNLSFKIPIGLGVTEP